jgi:hypothetical protein
LSSRALNVVLSEQLVILTPKAEDNLERRVLQPCLHGYNRAEEVGACPIQLNLVFEKKNIIPTWNFLVWTLLLKIFLAQPRIIGYIY